MKEFLANVWVKRCVSIFTTAYVAVIALLTYATFLYDLIFVSGMEASFLVIYAVASLVFMLLMIYTREMFVTRLMSIFMLPIVFFLLLFNIGNSNWVVIIPPLVVAIVMFFVAGTGETVKVIMGTIYLLLYVLGIVAYVVCNLLFGGSSVETVLDPYTMDTDSTVYEIYKDQMGELSDLVDDENAISPDGKYRFYLTDVRDSDRGCIKIYVVPYGEDINLKFFSLNQKGIRKTITNKGTRGSIPEHIGWVEVGETRKGEPVYGLKFQLSINTEPEESRITKMPSKNYLEFLGLS